MAKTEAHTCAPEGSLTVLRSILRELSPGAPLEESLGGLLKVLSKQMGYMRVFLAIMDPESESLRLSLAHSPTRSIPATYTPGKGVVGQVFETGHAIIIPKLSENTEFLNKAFGRSPEELEPVLETEIRALAQKLGINLKILGKTPGPLPRFGEYDTAMVAAALRAIMGQPEPETACACGADPVVPLPNRPPNLCAGCPHRATYAAVRKVFGDSAIYSSDIGCYTLGLLPPLKAADFLICMAAEQQKRPQQNHGHNGHNLDGGKPEFHFAKKAHMAKVYAGDQQEEKGRGLPWLDAGKPVLHIYGNSRQLGHGHTFNATAFTGTLTMELALLLVKTKQYPEAEKLLNSVTGKQRTPLVDYYHARALIGMDRPNEAVAYLQRAIKDTPDFVEALAELAFIYEQKPDLKAARGVYEKLLKLNFSSQDVLLRLINISLRMGQPERALKYMQQGPDSTPFKLTVASMFMDSRHFLQAESLLKQIVAQGDAPHDVYLLLAELAYDQRRDLDMIDTAGTLCAGADVLLKNGATKIVACATHAVLSGPAIDRINSTEALSQVFVTDTIPMGDKLERCPKLEVVSVAALLGKTIHNIHTGSSVSVLFV